MDTLSTTYTGAQRMRDAERRDADVASMSASSDHGVEHIAFSDDEFEEQQWAADRDRGDLEVGNCPVCEVQEAGAGAGNAHIANIMDMEAACFGKVPDLRVFDDVSTAYNEQIVEPNARAGRPMRKWNRLTVRTHFDTCRIIPRRRAAQVLRRASNIMDATYRRCRVRDLRTGETRVDHKNAALFFGMAQKYFGFLRDYRGLAGVDANGAPEGAKVGGTGTKKPAAMEPAGFENSLLYHFSSARCR